MRLLFVHIAKTGGTSLRRLLRSMPATSSFDCLHHNYLLRFEQGEQVSRERVDPFSLSRYDFAVVTVRHPLERLRSCHRYFLAGGLNGRGKGHFPGDAAVQDFLHERAPTLDDCCYKLHEIAARIPHFQPACHWLDVLPNPMADVVFTARQESMQRDAKRLCALLGIPAPVHELDHLNRSDGASDKAWQSNSLVQAERFYHLDFQRFGYSTSLPPVRRLIQYWNHSEPPSPVNALMQTVRDFHPHWDYQCFDRHRAAEELGWLYGKDLKQAFLDIRLPAMQADVFRIAYLLRHGGIWIDAATVLHEPIDSWMPFGHPLVLLKRKHQRHPEVATGFMWASPGHPLLARAWDRIAAYLLKRSGTKVYRHFGPGILRDLIREQPQLGAMVHVLAEQDVSRFLCFGSSSDVLSKEEHWSKRQDSESLYLSDG
tara:strand:+ start:612 stop:1895 length:1284 start_codon:yes stop_codon:yes gene_type:complete